MLLGWRVVRFTWQQVMHEPAYVAATLRGPLGKALSLTVLAEDLEIQI